MGDKNNIPQTAESRTGKYTTLILLVLLFIFLFVGILMMNFVIADKLGKETQTIDIASRQGTLSQRITRSITEFELLALQQYVRTIETLNRENDLAFQTDELLNDIELNPEGEISSEDFRKETNQEILTDEQIELDNFYINRMEELRNEIRDYSDIFDWTLEGFRSGGTTRDIDDESIELAAITEGRAKEIIDETEIIWRRFKDNINILMNRRVDDFISKNDIDTILKEASEYARANNVRLLNLMNELARELTKKTTEQATNLRLVQFGGIGLAIVFFLLIMYYILLRFRSADQKLDLAKRETDEIMANVGGGLFLLNQEFVIASQHSADLTRIFNDKKLGGERFDRLLKEILPKETLETAIDYINLLLGDRVNEKLVSGLNPMDEVEVNFPDHKGGFKTKYLEFNFNRTTRDGGAKHILVTVNDVSDKVKLAKELEESYEHREAQLELLMNILHINPQELLIFIDEAELSLNNINDILRESNTTVEDNRNKISKIFRIAHSLKGDASALELETFERMTHQFEDELEMIKKIRSPDGNDFIPLVVKLEDMLSHMQAIKEIALRLSELGTAVSDSLSAKPGQQEAYSEEDAETDNWAFVEQLANKVALEEGKLVDLEVRGISDDSIPEKFQKLIRDAIIQFTRNSIVHGIEEPAVRTSLGKSELGKLQIVFHQKEDGEYELIFRDDGQGVDKEKVKNAAISKSLISNEQADKLNPNQIYGLIFRPGFSTADKTTENAGRGVGMDVVRTKVKESDGKIKFKTNSGQFTEFRILLPA